MPRRTDVRLRLLSVLLALVGLVCIAQQPSPVRGQIGVLGCGQTNGKALLYRPCANGAAAFQGMADIVALPVACWSLRACSLAVAGTKAVRLVRASDSTQQDINTLASGSLDVSSATTFCNATTCKAVTLYDQSGGTKCTGVACDATQGTDAARPAFTLSCIGSLPCLTFAGAQTLVTPSYNSGQINQPYTLSAVGERNGNTSAFQNLLSNQQTDYQDGFSNSVNTILLFAGSVATAVGNDSAFHAIQFLHNGASSVVYVDGSSNSVSGGADPVLTGAANALQIGSTGGGISNALTGLFAEGGIWSSGFSAGNQSSMNSNQRGYWGF